MIADHLERRFLAALSIAAENVAPEPGDKSFLEKRLASAVRRCLEPELGPLGLRLNQKVPGFVLREWDPQPGWFDVTIVDVDGMTPLFVAELKLDDVDQTVWDILKLASALSAPSVETAIMATAAPASVWDGDRDAVALYRTRQGEDAEWYTRFVLGEYRKAWAKCLADASARPIELPAIIVTTRVLTAPVANFPPYELRALRVQRVGGSLLMSNGWPAPNASPREIQDQDLKLADLPGRDAPELELHRFALTTNGYERMGSHHACALLANDAVERWRETGELPSTLADLRCCLFFEQRRAHHSGYPFDERTLTYVRALIEGMRPLLAA